MEHHPEDEEKQMVKKLSQEPEKMMPVSKPEALASMWGEAWPMRTAIRMKPAIQAYFS